MGLLNAISNWQQDRYQKHVSKMQSLDKCPDCRGRGYINTISFDYAMPYECPGCNGGGSYSDWEGIQS